MRSPRSGNARTTTFKTTVSTHRDKERQDEPLHAARFAQRHPAAAFHSSVGGPTVSAREATMSPDRGCAEGAGAGTFDALDAGRRQRALIPATRVVAKVCSVANTTVASSEDELIVVSLGDPFT